MYGSEMSVDSGALIVGIVMLVVGVGVIYAAIALIRNLHGFGDKALANYADYPGSGGWRRPSADDPSHPSSDDAAFIYVPKTMRQVKRVGWSVLAGGLFATTLGVLFTVAAFTGSWE